MERGGHVCENELEYSRASGKHETVFVSICPRERRERGFESGSVVHSAGTKCRDVGREGSMTPLP